jgi:hypothetical protein
MMARDGRWTDVQHLLSHEKATTTDLYLQSRDVIIGALRLR